MYNNTSYLLCIVIVPLFILFRVNTPLLLSFRVQTPQHALRQLPP